MKPYGIVFHYFTPLARNVAFVLGRKYGLIPYFSLMEHIERLNSLAVNWKGYMGYSVTV